LIRHVSYPKALLAGMAGAIAWEAVARPLIAAGLPWFDIVKTLGTLIVPRGAAWLWWVVGMSLHLLVGAIWAVFYAYFFWALLRLRPAAQGLLFAFVPMPLAMFIMRPQLELMHPLVMAGELPWGGLFGVDGGLAAPLSIVAGHLIWGAVLGVCYTRPVGHPVQREQPPGVVRAHPPERRHDASRSPDGEHRFLFATGIECSYPTVENGRWRIDQMEATGHYRHWGDDLERVSSLGLRYLRYGPPLYLIHAGPGRYDWAWFDDIAAAMRRLGIVPIVDLCHFGLPTWLENFQNPDVPAALAEYARAFARRYTWIRFYTPVNEMYVCARLSALEGVWNEQRSDDRSFVTAVAHLAKASVLMMQAIAAERPDAIFVNSESSEFYQACCPDENIRHVAEFENERRFMPLDLTYGRPMSENMRRYLLDHGMAPDDYEWFLNQRVCDRAIVGLDYYEWNEKLVDADGHARALGELFGWYVIARQYYDRYRRPLMHTETNRMDARDAPHWLWRQWHNVQLIRQSGVPVVGFTWYSLTDQVDWDIALRAALGVVNPVGLYDLNRDVRPVGQAYYHLIRMFHGAVRDGPSIEAVLARASDRRAPSAAADQRPCSRS
jgi:beta-glucosidase/6-phospho-beta-glucosidase/beta-galactosidase